jgi:hypothetical protein
VTSADRSLSFAATAAAPALRMLGPRSGFRTAALPERGLSLWLGGRGDPRALLDAFAARGHAAWLAMRERFVAVVAEERPARVHVVTDCHAAIPVYRSADATGVALSCSLGDGVRAGLHALAWDPAGIAELLTFGHCLRSRTALRDVARLARSSVTTFDRSTGRETTERWWSAERTLATEREPLAARRDELLARLREAIDLRADETPLCTTLSGGLDTRVMAAVLSASGRRPLAITAGVPGGTDDRVARRVAAELGFEHRFVAIDAASIGPPLPLLREAAARLDGRGLVEGIAARRVMHELPAGATVFQGGFAELAKLEGAHEIRVRFGRVPDRADLPGSVSDCFARNDACLRPLYAPDVRAAVAPLDAMAAVVRGFVDHLEPIEAITAFYLEERLEQALASHSVYGDGIAVPFADPWFVDALLHVRGADRIRPRVHQFVLQRLAPKLLSLPDANTALPAWAPGPARDLGRAFHIATLKMGFRFAQAHDDFCAKAARVEPDPGALLRGGRLLADGIFCEAGIEELHRAAASSEHAASVLLRTVLLDLWASSLSPG